jgi:hypothetical protein
VNVADVLKPSTIYINSTTDRIFYTDNKSSVKQLVVESVGSGGDTYSSVVRTSGDQSVGGTKNFTGTISCADITVNGNLSKESGSFKISHPLPEKKDTHYLVHSFTESPFADLLYSGMVELGEGGTATVNIDDASDMTRGTLEALTCNRRRTCTNETGFTAIRSELVGNELTVVAQDSACRDTIYWQVIGERCDKHMKKTKWTDANGRVIVEPLKKLDADGKDIDSDDD